MPAWIWILLGLTVVAFVLRLLDVTGLEATERYGKALAILFILVVIGALMIGFMNIGRE